MRRVTVGIQGQQAGIKNTPGQCFGIIGKTQQLDVAHYLKALLRHVGFALADFSQYNFRSKQLMLMAL